MVEDFFSFIDQIFPIFAPAGGIIIALIIAEAIIHITKSLWNDREY